MKSRLTRVRSDYDVDDYVQTDLYLHLDGIRNAGATADHDAAATTWADLANGNDATFDFANAGVTGDGWTDNGYRFVYGGKFAGLPDTLNFGSVVTIQAVCDVGKSGKTSGSSWQMLFGATNDFFNVYTGDGNGNTIVFKIFNNQAQVKDANNVITTYTGGRQQMSGTWTGKYITAIWSAGKYTVFQDAVPDPGRWAGTWRYNWEALTGRPFYVGGVYFPESAGETNNRRLTGTIHALRVYKRALRCRRRAGRKRHLQGRWNLDLHGHDDTRRQQRSQARQGLHARYVGRQRLDPRRKRAGRQLHLHRRHVAREGAPHVERPAIRHRSHRPLIDEPCVRHRVELAGRKRLRGRARL